jgi:hypothetical protein
MIRTADAVGIGKNLPFELKGRSDEVIALVQYAKENGLYDAVADGLRSAFEYDKKYFDKLVASLLPLMEKLISGKVAELLAPDYEDTQDPRPIFDWMQVIRRRGIVYVGLDAQRGCVGSVASSPRARRPARRTRSVQRST